MYFNFKNYLWSRIFKNRLITDSDNSSLKHFYGTEKNSGIQNQKLNPRRIKFFEKFSILTKLAHIQDSIRFSMKNHLAQKLTQPNSNYELHFLCLTK